MGKEYIRKVKETKPVVAICYDFDKTLTPDDMQSQGFIQKLGYEVSSFWDKSNGLSENNDMDQNLAYMYTMLQESEGKVLFTKDGLKEYGAKLQFFPGVEDWFERIRKYADEKGVILEHYIISSGLKEMIEGSKVSDSFERIYASSFYYNERDKRDGDEWITQVGELSVPKDKIKFSGNGSLMRALPFVFYLYNKKISVEEKVRIMCDMSSITHYSDDCKACCVFYMFFIYNLIETKDIKKSIELSRNDLNTYYDLGKCDGINRILNNDFWDIPILELKTSGYVIDTFETCLNLLCNTNNYEDAVLVAVNLGGDTDTIAAITGSMAAIYYGENSVPEKWIDKIEKKEMIDNIIDNYLKFLNSQ